MDNRFFNFEISINNLPDIEDKVNMFKYDYESRTRPNMTTKKVVSILNEIINSKRYFYLLHKSILNLTEKYQPQTLYKVLHKCSKHSISAREIEDYYNELSRYLKSQPKETNGKRVKSLEKKRRK